MKVGFETVVSYFPKTVMKRGDFSYLDPAIPEEQRIAFRGPDEVRRLKDKNAVEILGEGVAKMALDSAGLRTSDIDYIIAQNMGGKHSLPMVGTYIHHKLGFLEDTPVLNIQESFIDACHVAWNLILAGEYKRVLSVAVAAVGTGGWGLDPTDPVSKNFGDGAGAVIVSSQNLKCEFLSYANRTLGEMYDHLFFNLRPPLHPELQKEGGEPITVGNYLTATPQFFEWQLEHGKGMALESIKKALKKAHLTFSDLDMIIDHQADDILHERWIEGLVEAGVSRDKWKQNWNKYGDLGAANVPAILAEVWEQGQIPKDSILALFEPGLGGVLPCIVLKWLG